MAYMPFLDYQGTRQARRLAGKEWLPSTTGKILRLISSGVIARDGEFIADGKVSTIDDLRYIVLKTPGIINLAYIPVYVKPVTLYRFKPRTWPAVFLTCLSEPSFKARTLGKGETSYNLTWQSMRFMAEPVLARDGRARIGLVDTNKLWTFLKYISRNS